MIDILFVGLSLFAVLGGAMMVLYRNPIYSALGLLVSMLSVAGLFLLLQATFLFVVQIIVYVGAVITLLLFILMFLNIRDEDLPHEPRKFQHIVLVSVLLVPLNVVILKAIHSLPDVDLSVMKGDFGDIKPLGMFLFEHWLLAFELVSVLLLVVLVGSVVLVQKKRSISSDNKKEM